MTKPLKTACMIDDDLIYTYTLRKMIGSCGLADTCISFTNGQLALDFFQENLKKKQVLPDLILLDINMPVMNGWEFLEAYGELLAELPKKIPLYVVSSSVDRQEHERAKAIPCVKGFLVKPVSMDTLRELALK